MQVTPTPVPVTSNDVIQYLDQSAEVLKIYQDTSIALALILLLILIVIAVILMTWVNRKKVDPRDAAFMTLSGIVAKQEARLESQEKLAEQTDVKYLETFIATGEQIHRLADTAERHERGEEEQRAINKRIADVLEETYKAHVKRDTTLAEVKRVLDDIAQHGSQPLRDIAESTRPSSTGCGMSALIRCSSCYPDTGNFTSWVCTNTCQTSASTVA